MQKKPSAKTLARLCPTEDKEHLDLAQYLDARFGYYGWYHPANERISNVQGYVKLKKKGTKPGFPDFIILRPVRQPIPGRPDMYFRTYSGMAIELKRQHGGVVSADQTAWLDELAEDDWAVYVAYGAQDAINKIESVYGKWVR